MDFINFTCDYLKNTMETGARTRWKPPTSSLWMRDSGLWIRFKENGVGVKLSLTTRNQVGDKNEERS